MRERLLKYRWGKNPFEVPKPLHFVLSFGVTLRRRPYRASARMFSSNAARPCNHVMPITIHIAALPPPKTRQGGLS